MTYISEKTVKARKPHVCECCSGNIPAKTKYVRYAGVNDGSAFTLHYHVECRAQEVRVNRIAAGHGEEWMSLWEDIENGGIEVLTGYIPIVAFRMLSWVKRGDDRTRDLIETRFVERIADLQMEVADLKAQMVAA